MSGRRYTCEAYKNEWRHLFKINNSKIQPISCQWDFPHCLKQAEVIPVFKNKRKLDKSNNRPVNVLPVISKIYERLMYDQMFNMLIKSSLNFNVVFVKDLALRNYSLYMTQNWKEWALKLLEWFWSNFIEMNSDKYHLISFPSYKVTNQAQLLMRIFIMSQFSYCRLIWMCHSRNINNQINKLHGFTLRLVYSDKNSSFRELLETDKLVTIHKRTLLFGNFLKQISQSLFMKELFKYY